MQDARMQRSGFDEAEMLGRTLRERGPSACTQQPASLHSSSMPPASGKPERGLLTKHVRLGAGRQDGGSDPPKTLLLP